MLAAPPPQNQPIVVMTPDSFTHYPLFMNGAARMRLMAIDLAGATPVTDAAKQKLALLGWKADYRTDQTGHTLLSINTFNKTLPEAIELIGRVQRGEFGAATAQLVSIPDQSAPN